MARDENNPIVVSGKAGTVTIYSTSDNRFTLSYYLGDERKLERRSTLSDCRARAKEVLKSMESGGHFVQAFDVRQTAVIREALRHVPESSTLSEMARDFAIAHQILGANLIVEAARHYSAYLLEEKVKKAPVPVGAVTEEFLEDLKTRNMSLRYQDDCRTRLMMFKRTFACTIGSIKVADLTLWLTGLKVSGRTQNNYRAVICRLFSFARTLGYLPNQQTEIEKTSLAPEVGTIECYTPDQFKAMLQSVDPGFLPMLALGGFAGLRTAEIHRLDWSAIEFQNDRIKIRSEVAKKTGRKTRTRHVKLCAALKAWLQPYAKKHGPVVQRYTQDASLLRAFALALAPAKVQLVHNGLRHSYASYRLAETKHEHMVSREMGNSPRMLQESYDGHVTEQDAVRWFSLTPERCEVKFTLNGSGDAVTYARVNTWK